jgi:lysophospholipase L1-like esterase
MKLFLCIFILSLNLFSKEREIRYREILNPETDAFSMIGDSRTEFVFDSGFHTDWEGKELLGDLKSECSNGKVSIHNAGQGGSTASEWLEFLKSGKARPENFHKRIVIMIGGNDVLRNIKNYLGLIGIHNEKKEMILDQIHSNVMEIINILLSWEKEIIIQTHFKANPNTKTKYYKAANEGIIGLNERLIKSFEIQKLPNVSLLILPDEFPSLFFIDKVHLNFLGYKYHSQLLNKELKKRCWW